MHNRRGPATNRGSNGQLSFIEDFDKSDRRYKKLVDEFKNHISNLKYYRTNTRYAETANKKELDATFGQILYWIAFLMHKKSRHIEAHKGQTLDDFLALTREPGHLNVTDILEVETLQEYYMNSHRRFKTTCMAYKDLLQDETVVTKKILTHFDTLHNLIHAI